MRRFLSRGAGVALMALTMMSAGCDGGPAEVERQLRPAPGTYALAAVDGQPLPVVTYYDAGYDTDVAFVSGQMVLREDGTFSKTEITRVTRIGKPSRYYTLGSERTARLDGTYVARGSTITYRSVRQSKENVQKWERTDTTVTVYTFSTQVGTYRRME